MVYIISKPTRREAESQRREALAKQGLSPQRFRGTARTVEEAHDQQRELERQGEKFDRLWAVDNNARESKQAKAEGLLRAGVNPETMEPLHSRSTSHG